MAGFLIAFLGGSRVQISGPTAAFATIVAGIVATDGMEGLVAATIIAGVMLVLMGLLKLGTLIRFVPYTMTKCICMKTRMTSGSSWRQRLSTSGAPSPSS
ncbi:SulP family inorganic anion transporter [Senegalimassilia anaerobia]|uniref:SulP family inorganic anion transporter n=1 Tax=Senegalimassilia anaerobia TaxID=1473216 RepID=UPI003A9720A9